MSGKNVRRATFAAITISALALGGCLSKEEQGSGFDGNQSSGSQNRAPTISGSPSSTILMGQTYTFTPTANDPDGDVLTFGVSNLPAWASFDSTTGTLSGQPSLSDIGVFARILISVSDGSLSSSLPEYSITVTQAALGSMTLSWMPPTLNTDGTPLSDLAGYKIYYGTTAGNYPNSISITTAGTSTYVIENLVPDTYYVVATAVNAAGVESNFSNMAVKIVN